MGERELLDHVHAVGLHGFPGTWDSESGSWLGWDHYVEETRQIVDRYNPAAEIWITETGYSTWRQDEAQQARRFLGALAAPVQRMYWYSWRDVPSEVAVQEGHWFDPRHYYLGAVDQANRPKLLARLLMDGGVPRVRMVTKLGAPSLARRVRTIAITGGSGFIGCNLANSYLRDGEDVVIIDNLSRNGVEQNLNWMRDQYGSRVHAVLADIRDPAGFEDAIADAKAVVHLAAQTAVTSSFDDPLHDFEVNARGSINVLEAVRRSGRDIPVLFSSTNKVYGGLEELEMMELDDRYIPADEALRSHGIGEDQKLDLCTPYGCSKGVADQYVLDYAKHFGVRSSVLRMSCIYGPHQFGTEDQGWVAHFLLKALRGEPISVYGDGKQVRDVLHVDDAVAAYRALLTATDRVSGQAFNLGGGPHNAVSINAVLRQIDRLLGQRTPFTYGDWRQGDQLYFVADTRKLSTTVGWRARISWREGLADLCNWLARHRIQRPAIRRAIA
jgi:CDP-paratose 2-epimerase